MAEMQRRRLLLAFGELLPEVGLEGASIGRICKRARVSRRTFYEQFASREECFAAAFRSDVQRVGADLLGAFKGSGAWTDRVRSALASLLDHLDRDPGFACMCLVESLHGGEEIMRDRAKLLDALAQAVDEGRQHARSSAGAPPLTAEGVVGGIQAVLYTRLFELDPPEFHELLGSLMGMIVYPYLGAAASQRELRRPQAPMRSGNPVNARDPFKDLPIRFTYRTARVLEMIASTPGASNRAIANISGIADEGQMSRLLRRLQSCELIENRSSGQLKGEPNAWALTERGEAVHRAISNEALVPIQG